MYVRGSGLLGVPRIINNPNLSDKGQFHTHFRTATRMCIVAWPVSSVNSNNPCDVIYKRCLLKCTFKSLKEKTSLIRHLLYTPSCFSTHESLSF